MRAGVIDVGTNTVRLLVCDLGGGIPVREIERDVTFARLGEGVDRTGVLSDAAITRATSAIGAYAERWRGCDVTRAIATSAVRDAGNAGAFVAHVRTHTGVRLDVISGDEEARLAFAGATLGLDGSAVVLDIGGGSTEIVAGADGHVDHAVSLDIGAVRLTERHVRHDPPLPDEVAALRAEAAAAVAGAPRLPDGATFVGVAGTITSLAVLALGLDRWDPDAVHHATLSRDQAEVLLARLAGMTSPQRAALPCVAGREDVIVAGTAIFLEVVDHLGTGLCVISVSDILDGTAISAGTQEPVDGPTNA